MADNRTKKVGLPLFDPHKTPHPGENMDGPTTAEDNGGDASATHPMHPAPPMQHVLRSTLTPARRSAHPGTRFRGHALAQVCARERLMVFASKPLEWPFMYQASGMRKPFLISGATLGMQRERIANQAGLVPLAAYAPVTRGRNRLQ